MLSGLLKSLVHKFDIANTGGEAVEFFKANSYDLIFMDIMMPVLDGLAATQIIRRLEAEQQSENSVPIIGLSANAQNGNRDEALLIGVSDYLIESHASLLNPNLLVQPAMIILHFDVYLSILS